MRRIAAVFTKLPAFATPTRIPVAGRCQARAWHRPDTTPQYLLMNLRMSGRSTRFEYVTPEQFPKLVERDVTWVFDRLLPFWCFRFFRLETPNIESPEEAIQAYGAPPITEIPGPILPHLILTQVQAGL